jgi:DNA replication protein DnaD
MTNSAPPSHDTELATDRPSAVVAKWGNAANAGFQFVPDVLLKNQSELGLTALELVVLINLTMHWWYADQRPFPRSTTIAERMGVDVRTVQRALKRLAGLDLIQRVTVQTDNGEGTVIDLDGLVNKLSKLALRDPAYRPRSTPPNNASPGPVRQNSDRD